MFLIALLGLVLYIIGGELALKVLLWLRWKVLSTPMVVTFTVHAIVAGVAFCFWLLGWMHDTISSGNVGIPWVFGVPLNMPFSSGPYWKIPGLMQVNEISMVPQTTGLNGTDEKGMEVLAKGNGNITGSNASTFVEFLLKVTVIWRIYDPFKFFTFLELNWGDETDWDAAVKKAQNAFVPKVNEFIRAQAAKTSYEAIITTHLHDEVEAVRLILNSDDIEVISGIGIEVRELAISKVVAKDPKFATLLAGGAEEAQQKKKETTDLDTFNVLLAQAMKGLVKEGWSKTDPATREEAMRIVREVQGKQGPAQRYDISGIGNLAALLAQVMGARRRK
ncbi:MAG: hypothetical protein RL094_598 [Candidatus Parcubacteria bacterium]